MAIYQTDRNQVFNHLGQLLSEEVVQVDVTDIAVTLDLHQKARNALQANQNFLNKATPSNAEILAQVRLLTREVNALIRLLIGNDLLVENTDT